MTDDERVLRNETLDHLYELRPLASGGWWCGARSDPARERRVRLVQQLILEGTIVATIGEDDWIANAQLTSSGRREVTARRAIASVP